MQVREPQQEREKQLIKTVKILTAQVEGKLTPKDKDIEAENEKMKEGLVMLRAQLKDKIDECEMKEQLISDLTEDFAAYQSVTSDTWAHRHDGCNELNAALDEQCEMLTVEHSTLHNNLNRLIIERHDLQRKFDVSGRSPYLFCSYRMTISGCHQDSSEGA